jgi:hypothetical protein
MSGTVWRRKRAVAPRGVDVREVVNAIRSLLRSGDAWHLLTPECPPWPTVYASIRRWRADDTKACSYGKSGGARLSSHGESEGQILFRFVRISVAFPCTWGTTPRGEAET